MTVILVILMFAIFIIADVVIQKVREHKSHKVPESIAFVEATLNSTFNEEAFTAPANILYHKGHTWANVIPNGEIKVGLDEFALKIFNRIDNIKLGKIGDKVDQGKVVFTLTQGDREAQFLSPISGEISSVNKEIKKNPSTLKQNPYESGWIYFIKPKNLTQEILNLKIGEEAKNWLSNEIQRLKDFLIGENSKSRLSLTTLVDGGIPVEGIINYLDDAMWDRLKIEFLN